MQLQVCNDAKQYWKSMKTYCIAACHWKSFFLLNLHASVVYFIVMLLCEPATSGDNLILICCYNKSHCDLIY